MTSKPPALSDTAQKVLTAAAAREDRRAVGPAKLPRAACSAVARTLLRAHWVERTEAEHAALWYPEPGRPTGLRITDAGLRAIGIEPALEPTLPPAEAPPAVGQDAPTDARTSLRRAAQEVVQAWDDEGSPGVGLPEAVERLRVLLARVGAIRLSTASPRRPREGTKQAQVIALLRRPEGASGPQIADSTGWAPHTVRGFLAGLGSKGVPVTVLERVRQVGPAKAGAKGSYTVYRVVEAG